MSENINLTASLRNYLKAIYLIVTEYQAARAKDIAKKMGVGNSSVTEALRALTDKKLINYEPYGIITLTQQGKEVAEGIIDRHKVICNFFENVLSVDSGEIEEAVYKIEHEIPKDALTKFVRFLSFMQTCPCKEPKWMRGFTHYCKTGEISEKCQSCIFYCESRGVTKPLTDNSDGHKCCGSE